MDEWYGWSNRNNKSTVWTSKCSCLGGLHFKGSEKRCLYCFSQANRGLSVGPRDTGKSASITNAIVTYSWGGLSRLIGTGSSVYYCRYKQMEGLLKQWILSLKEQIMSPTSEQKKLIQQNQQTPPIYQEEATMRKVVLFYVMGFCTLSEVAGIVLFCFTKNAEIAIMLQVPGMLCLYKILNYLFPGKSTDNHPFIQLLSLFKKHSGIGW